jgi:hypothetical protein
MQIRCAIATYALIAILNKELQLKVSLYTRPQSLSDSVFEKHRFHAPCGQTSSHTLLHFPNQLILFDIKPDTTAS